MTLPINEIFDTLQGEAAWTGTPSTFVRMQFCDVGCPWCDTKHTWTTDPGMAITAEQMISKSADAATYADFRTVDLAVHILERAPRHVVITGGEPCHYDLRELTRLLLDPKTVQIETSGTRTVRCDPAVWVTVSPKFDMPGGYFVLDSALQRADEIKMPVGRQRDVDKVIELQKRLYGLREKWRQPVIWLQPLSQSPKATALCVAAATEHGFRVSLQTHKYLGLR